MPAVIAAPMVSSLESPAGISCALICSSGWSAFHASTICLPHSISASLFEYQIVMSPRLSLPPSSPPALQAESARRPIAPSAVVVMMRRRMIVPFRVRRVAALCCQFGGAAVDSLTTSRGASSSTSAGVSARDRCEQRSGRERAPGRGIRRHRGERREDVVGELGVVEAGDRQIVGHGDARTARDRQPGDRHVVVGVDDRGGPIGASEELARGTSAVARAEVGRHDDGVVEPGVAHRGLERDRAAVAVEHGRRARHVRDATVPEGDEVLDRRADARTVVDRHGRERGEPVGAPEGHGGEAELRDERDALVAGPEVGEDDAVDALVGGEPAIGLGLGAAGGRRREHEHLSRHRELALDAGDEGVEEGVGGDHVGTAPDHEAERERAIDAERARPYARAPAELLGHREDAIARVGAHAGPVVEREGDEALADPRLRRDVGDRRSSGLGGVRRARAVGSLHRVDHVPPP